MQTIMADLANQITTALNPFGVSADLLTPTGPTFAQILVTGTSATSYPTPPVQPSNTSTSPLEEMADSQFSVAELNYDVYTLSGGAPTSSGVPILLFDNYSQVNSTSLIAPTSPATGCLMASIYSGGPYSGDTTYGFNYPDATTKVPCFIVLFESNINAVVPHDPLPAFTTISNTVSHELGHVLAYLYARDGILSDGYKYDGVYTGTYKATATSLWLHSLTTDLSILDAAYPCAVHVSDTDIEDGLLTNAPDIFNGGYFCTPYSSANAASPLNFDGPGNADTLNSPTYTSNLQALQTAEPNVYKDLNFVTGDEVFAQSFSMASGNANPQDEAALMSCEWYIAEGLLWLGTTGGDNNAIPYYASGSTSTLSYTACPTN
jgi:hypothetical protein